MIMSKSHVEKKAISRGIQLARDEDLRWKLNVGSVAFTQCQLFAQIAATMNDAVGEGRNVELPCDLNFRVCVCVGLYKRSITE